MFSLVVTVFVAPCIVDILPKLWCCPSHLYSCSLFLNCAFYIYFWGHWQKRYMFQTYKYIVGVCICTSGTARIIEQTDMTNTLILEQAKDWKKNCKMMTKVRNIYRKQMAEMSSKALFNPRCQNDPYWLSNDLKMGIKVIPDFQIITLYYIYNTMLYHVMSYYTGDGLKPQLKLQCLCCFVGTFGNNLESCWCGCELWGLVKQLTIFHHIPQE